MSDHAERPRVAMILAAGRGERMRPLTDSTPKPLLTIRGKPLLVHHLERLAAAGYERAVINVSWLGEQIRDRVGDGSRYGLAVRYSDESARALETAGGILHALPHLAPGPFAVVNGDVYTDYPFGDLKIDRDRDAHLVLVPNPPQHPQGDFALDGGLAVAAGPVAAATPGAGSGVRHTFAGIAVYRVGFFAGCVEGVLPLKPLLVRAMDARRCSAELYAGLWEDVGTPARLQALNR